MEFHVPGERLEDDESLKMHVLGVHSLFSKYLVIVMSFSQKSFKLKWLVSFVKRPTKVHRKQLLPTCEEMLPTRYLPPGNIKMMWLEFSQTNPGISYLCPAISLLLHDFHKCGNSFPDTVLLKVCNLLEAVQDNLVQHSSFPCSI